MEKETWSMIGIIVGFGLSVLKDFITEKTKKKYKENELRRNKLEELYIEVDKWFNYSSLNQANFILSLSTDKNYLDLSEERKNFNYDLIKIEMIISVYIEKLKDEYNEIITKKTELSKLEMKELNKEDKKEKYIDLNNNFCNLMQNMKKKIADEVKSV